MKLMNHKKFHFCLFIFAFSYFLMCPSTHDRMERLSGQPDLAVLNLSEYKLLKSKDCNDAIPDGYNCYFDTAAHHIFSVFPAAEKRHTHTHPSITQTIISTTRLLL